MAIATGQPETSADTNQHPAEVTFATFAATLWSFVEHGLARARACGELHRLDDRTLRDIGVHRNEISSILHHDLRDPSRRQR